MVKIILPIANPHAIITRYRNILILLLNFIIKRAATTAKAETAMLTRNELNHYVNELLQTNMFSDYCPNGLQVEGKSEIKKIVTGVTANIELIERAIAAKADAIIVHHGYFWKGENQCVVGMKQRRLAALLKNDLSLFAWHLPLDAHPTLGNNAQLANDLGIVVDKGLDNSAHPIGLVGHFEKALTPAELVHKLNNTLNYDTLHVGTGAEAIKTVAFCTGGAQSYLDKAIALGVDAFITGEISENTVHTANEMGIHYFAAGHHATERGGVRNLGEHLAEKFAIEHEFIDVPVPV
jgi:dinuclear metal center YbgI/SA1388 family protein